ncbi:MAG: GntR family transcriptional regulator [Pseudomonadota bacterium]
MGAGAGTQPPNGDQVSGLAGLAPVHPRTVHEEVYGALRGQIMRGNFAPGEVLRLKTVADTLQVSTMPVRDAFARLVSERALEAMPNRSVRIPPLDTARLEDLAATRSAVEADALTRAIAHVGAGDIRELASLTDRYDEACRSGSEPPAVAADLNHAFHTRLYGVSGSAVLPPIIESLWLQSAPYLRAAADLHDGDPADATKHHRAIIAALETRNAEEAVAALRRDIDLAFSIVRRAVQSEAAA